MERSPRTPRGRVPAAAFLRVYEPLDALADAPAARRPAARARSAASDDAASAAPSVSRGAAVVADAAELVVRERLAALRAASALPPRVVHDVDLVRDGLGSAGSPAALLLSPAEPDGVPRLCPADLGWRAFLALDQLRRSVQPVVLRTVMPTAAMVDAARRLGETFHRGAAPHVRTSAWQVPLAWFAAFRPEQRAVAGDSEGAAAAVAEGGERALRYRAPMADARRCVARALAATRRVGGDLLPEGELEELGRWLEEFHARSVVELDFGGLVGLLPAAEFASDAGDGASSEDMSEGMSSVALVAMAVDELRARFVDRATGRLIVARDRWIAIRAYERAS